MSRIGNKPINVPDGVEVKVDGHHITVKGPKGTLEKDLHKNMEVVLADKVITVKRPNEIVPKVAHLARPNAETPI